MKAWDDWSNLILSAMVARTCGHKYEIFNDKIAIRFGGDERSGYSVTYFDINDPADMWPIIVDNGISIVLDGDYMLATNNPQELYEPMGSKRYECQFRDKSKALRAAAIVFLMINGINP